MLQKQLAIQVFGTPFIHSSLNRDSKLYIQCIYRVGTILRQRIDRHRIRP